MFPVDSVLLLEETNRGNLLEGHAVASDRSHASQLLGARSNGAVPAARVMLATVRALTFVKSGIYSLIDVPPCFWDERETAGESGWG